MSQEADQPLQPTQKDLNEAYREFRVHEAFCRESLAIRDKTGRKVPLVLGPAQQKLDAAIEECRRKGRPVRIIYLKARQVWVSVGTAAEFFHDCAFVPGQKALVVAHERDAAENIFGYYQQLQANYEPFRGCIDTLKVIRDKEGLLAWDGGGYVKVATANNLKTGRSFSLRFLHLSEFAFWSNAKKLMTGLMQAVPDDPNTIAVIESTANGVGGEFHRLCLEAMDPTTNSDWVFVFFAWWEHPEYVLDPAALGMNRRDFEQSLSDDEREIRENYSLRLEQMAWRRWAIKNKCFGSPDTFKQEYPGCPEEAFLFSGRPRFSHPHLNKMPAARKDASQAGTVGELEEYRNGPKQVTAFLPSERGPLVVYRKPAAGKQYVAGWDVAEGIDASKILGSADPDYTVGCILDQATGEQVAKFRCRMEPSPAAEYAVRLMRWYNWAYCVPEANSVGIAFIEGLLREEYPPALIYHRRPSPDEQFADGGHTALSCLGWKSNVATRVQLLSAHDTNIREFAVILTDPLTLQEHHNFVIKANGKAEASEGTHDDEVIATALAGLGLATAPADRTLGGVLPLKPPSGRGVKPAGTVTPYGSRRSTARTSGLDRGQLVRF